MSARHIGDAWESYRAKVIPADAGPEQVNECRLAFYAGAGTVFGKLARALVTNTADTIATLEALRDECGDFAAEQARTIVTGRRS